MNPSINISHTVRSNPVSRAKWLCATIITLLMMLACGTAEAQNLMRGRKQMVTGGVLIETVDSLEQARLDSLANLPAEVRRLSEKQAKRMADSLAREQRRRTRAIEMGRVDDEGNIIPREPWFADSMSLSRVTITSALLPGYGQIYNKQYWKLPILYGTLAGGLALYISENNKYKPLKRQFDAITDVSMERTPELDALQTKMIRSNTKRQVYLGLTLASYIYFIGDAAVNYSTNEVSTVKKATTLACICPGAGQIYNKSYWKVPFVIGGFATLGYCIDWNNRGFQRFKKAYNILADYEAHPENYPNGPTDEFRGRYSSNFIKNLRNNYRRNRDLCIILTAGLYVLQIVDAHVDAHLRDYDVSDDLSMNIEPMVNYTYIPTEGNHQPVIGFNLGFTF